MSGFGLFILSESIHTWSTLEANLFLSWSLSLMQKEFMDIVKNKTHMCLSDTFYCDKWDIKLLNNI